MLYTGKGDGGSTKLFDTEKGVRVSKSDFVFEVLGTLDELNSSIGYAKVLSVKAKDSLSLDGKHSTYGQILENFQQHLFCIQAEVGGSPLSATHEHVLYLEAVVREVEADLPPITTFIVPGGGESGAYLDVCRTVTRRTERLVVALREHHARAISNESITYLNRLSSALYALARYANYKQGFHENTPQYE